MTQQPTVRRAQPLDVVNLYRLVLAQGEFSLLDSSDEARALVQVLELITEGYVLVAHNKANRIVASIAFAGGQTSSGTPIAKGVWLAVNPSYRDSPVVAELLDLSTRSASAAGFPVCIPVANFSPDDKLELVVREAGFKRGSMYWIHRNKNKNGLRPASSGSDQIQPEV